MELIKLLQEGDATGLEMQKALEALEHAKKSVEQAKERYDLTKNYFEQVIARADEAGIPRAKFKKLIEERVAGLWNSGLISQVEEGALKVSKAARAASPVKKKKKEEELNQFSEADLDLSVEDSARASEDHETGEAALMN